MTRVPEQPAEGTERTAAVIGHTADTLARAGLPSPRVDAELLAAHVLGVPRSRLLLVEAVDADQQARLAELVAARVRRVPVQHLTGRAGFRYLELAVGPGVFVPRPETELLAGWGIETLTGAASAVPGPPGTAPAGMGSPGMGSPGTASAAPGPPGMGSAAPGSPGMGSAAPGSPGARSVGPAISPGVPAGVGAPGAGPAPSGPVVVDLCSGSGAIALAVANEFRAARVYAVEADPDALRWLRRNADERAAAGDRPIEIVVEDVTRAGVIDTLRDRMGVVDLVLCNPPYVPLDNPVPPEVAVDPRRAVFGGPDGLEVIAPVVALAAGLLAPGGAVAIEHDDGHAPAVLDLFRRHGGFTTIVDHQDLAGRPRFATAQRAHGRLHP